METKRGSRDPDLENSNCDIYDVFISFRGKDTRTNFTSHVYAALSRKKIKAFVHSKDLRTGHEISDSLLKAIETSKLYLVIFSPGYGSSRWCLLELETILRCSRQHRRTVVPVFYKVDPSHVRNQTGSFGDVFASKHEGKEEKEKVLNWIAALKEVAGRAGLHLNDHKLESKVIDEIVAVILREMKQMLPLSIPSNVLVGVSPHIEEIVALLRVDSPQVRSVGIWGMGGMGKTTIAESVFGCIHRQFDGYYFFGHVREEVKRFGKVAFLDKLVSKILDWKNSSFGISLRLHSVKQRLVQKKVFIVFDDVDDSTSLQLQELAEHHELFGMGSKILMTSRDRHALVKLNVDDVYEFVGLKGVEALKLFSLKAFKKELPPEKYLGLSSRVVRYAQGNALALKVLGSELFNRDQAHWRRALKRIEKFPNKLIIDSLRISYDGLSSTEKNVFLDIIYILKGEDVDQVEHLLKKFYNCVSSIMINLVDKSLISISPNGKIEVHNLVEEMGVKIIDEVAVTNPEEYKRLYESADIYRVLMDKKGTETNDVPGARKGSHHTASGDTSQQKPQGTEIRLTGMELSELPKAEEWEVSELIHLNDSQLLKLPENPRCPVLEDLSLKGNSKLRTIPPLFFDWMPALRVLDLSRTRIKSLPDSLFSLPKLKRLFLRHCNLLMKLSPKVGQLKGLQVLDLEGTEIMHLPGEVKELKKLKCLKVSFCELPSYRRVEEPDVLMISPGTLSALPLLEELSINVSPDDGRWNECVEPVVSEVSGLAWLYKLQFYFPSMEFLSHFQWFRFKAFKLTAGHLAAKRLMPRLPSDAEAELERYDKSFTSVHGDFESEMNNPVLQHADALFLDRHTTMKTLSVFGLDSFKHLRCCVIGECNELQVLFCVGQKAPHVSLEYLYLYYMKSLRHIWEGRLPPMVHLKYLTLRTCPMLSSIFSEDLIGSLNSLKSLQEIIIDDCPAIINLVRCNGFECTSSSGTAHNNFLPSLKRISLHYLPQLNDIFDLSRSRDLEWMSIYHCPNLKSLPIDTASNKNLNKIMGERSWWESLEWEDTEQHSWDYMFVEQELCY